MVEGIPGVRVREFDGQAMHATILLNLLVLLDLPRDAFEEAVWQTDDARREVGSLLVAEGTGEAATKAAGKEAINAVVYGSGLGDYGSPPPPLLARLHTQVRGLLKSFQAALRQAFQGYRH